MFVGIMEFSRDFKCIVTEVSGKLTHKDKASVMVRLHRNKSIK